MAAGIAHIGTSGWSYKHWSNGVFYPPKLPPRRWLEYFTERFSTVELNATFYRLPQESTFAGWVDRTPERFVFAVKASRIITHIKRLRDLDDSLDVFLARAALLGPKLGPILFQLPPSLRRDDGLLAEFLATVRDRAGGESLRLAFEARSETWFAEPVYAILSQARTALVFSDYGRLDPRGPATGPFMYVRRHGPGSRYNRPYPARAIQADADLMAQSLREGRDAFVYYNNDFGGHAIHNAREITDALRARGCEVD